MGVIYCTSLNLEDNMEKDSISVIGLKNIAMIVFSIIIFFSGIGFILYDNSSEALLQNIRQSLENRATDNARMISEIFKDKLTATKLIAENHDIKTMDWNKQKIELLSHIDTLEVKRFRISDKKGITRSTDGYITDLSDREHFIKALNGIPNVSDVVTSKSDNALLVVCACPIKDANNNVIGAVSYAMDYKILKHIVSSIKVGQNGYVVLMNNKGIAVVHPQIYGETPNISIFERVKNDPKLIELANLEKKMINGETGSGFFKQGNNKRFMAYSPILGTPWFIGMVVPENEVFSLLTSLRIKFIIVTLSFILLAFYMLYLIINYLSQKTKVEDLQKSADSNYKQMLEITELDRLKTEFFSNLSHELRTPLNVILSTLQLFEHYAKGDIIQNKNKIVKHTSAIKQNCFRLLRLINNLLDITRIDSGFFELRLQKIDMVCFIKELTDSVHEYAENNDLNLIFTTEVKKIFINCDPEKLERIILNLISNAIKFTPKGGFIYVNINSIESGVSISVKDTGIGIPQDKQGVIFERFKQVEGGSFTRHYEGSGIGLSIVKSLVEMHKGKIVVKSTVGIGSEFIIELPTNLDSDNDDEKLDLKFVKDGSYTEKIKVELSELNHKK